jgi:hypothetical protein
MSTIVTRAGKGSALTFAEVDSNFTNLNTDKYQAGAAASLASLTLSSALTPTNGGTGQSSYAVGDLLYASTTTALSKLADVATGNALISGGVGVAPAWGKIGLTTHVSGVLPVANGGTNANLTASAGSVAYSTASALALNTAGNSGDWLKSAGTSAPAWTAPAALTKTDDTNVTLTLGGSASTALLNAASLTLGWTGTLSVARGGTGTGTAFTAGSVVFAGASGTYSQDNANLFWDDANNRLGIGNAAPTVALDVTGAAAVSTSITSPIHIGGTGTTSTLTLRSTSGVGTTGADIVFQVGSNGGTEAARIVSTGHIGIGATPSAWTGSVKAIQIGSGASFSSWTGNNGVGSISSNLYDSGGAVLRYINSAAASRFDAGTGFFAWSVAPSGIAGNAITFTEAMRIDSSGNVGIGTSTPAQKLDVVGVIRSSSGANRITMAHDGTNGALANTGGQLLLYANGVQSIISHTDGVERMRVNPIGNVGIGTAAPSVKLDVTGAAAFSTSATTPIVYGGTGTTSTLSLRPTSGVGTTGADIVLQVGNNGATEAMRVLNSGVVLINTTTATNNARFNQKLAVASTGSGNYGGVGLTTYGGTTTDVCSIVDFQRSRGTTDGSLTAVASGDRLGYIIWRGSDGSAFQNAASIRAEVDATPALNDMPGRLVFLTTTDNTTTLSERMRIDSAGSVGIGATANLSTLTVNGSFASKSPSTVNAATYTVSATDGSLRFTTTNCTVTLPAAASFPGRILYLNTITANSVTSASSNVIPIGSNTAGTAIFAATAGKFAMLQSDGTNWITMMSN